MNEIKMPRLSDSMQEGTILSWLREDGKQISEGDELVEIETDKATMAYESPADGVLTIVAAVGETLPVGAVIATLGDGAQVSRAPAAQPDPEPVTAPDAPAEPEPEGNGSDPATVRATPVARRLAREHGIDLRDLRGTGPRGRITRSDVESRAGIQTRVEPPPSIEQTGETQELTRRQQVVARRMSEAKATIPHFQVQTEARIDALIALRDELKALGEQAAPVPSVNDLIVKACALALRAHPRANGSYRDGRFELHPAINVGIAVAAPDALVVVDDHRRRPQIRARDRDRVAASRRARARRQGHPARAVRGNVHGLQPRHVRDDRDHARDQSAAGGDPRGRRGARRAGARGRRPGRAPPDDTHAELRSPDPVRRRRRDLPVGDPRRAGAAAEAAAVAVAYHAGRER